MNGALVAIGLDSVDVARFAGLLERRPAIGVRLFTSSERDYAASLADPAPSLAARFAAKEAVMKALGVGIGSFPWGDVEVTRQPGGAPGLALTGRAAAIAEARGVAGWHLSITHTATVASAVVAAVS